MMVFGCRKNKSFSKFERQMLKGIFDKIKTESE